MEADALNRQYEHIKIKNTSFFYLDFILRKFNITLRRKPRACLLSLIVHFSVRRRNKQFTERFLVTQMQYLIIKTLEDKFGKDCNM